jgi:hypothetical protein
VGLWDVTLKVVMRYRPQDLLALVPGVERPRKVRVLDKEIAGPLAPRALDACVQIASEDEDGTVFHVEFESAPRSDAGRRVLVHYALTHDRLGATPLCPVVYYLTPGTEGRRPADRYQTEARGKPVCDLRFETVSLWQVRVTDVLAIAAPGLWALVGLCAGATVADVARARRQVDEQVRQKDERRELLAAMYLIAGTRLDAAALRRLFPKEVLMESSTYAEILGEGLEKGRQEGRQQGRQEGRAEGLWQACLKLAEARLSTVSEDTRKRIEALTDVAALEALLTELVSATDADQARAALDRV